MQDVERVSRALCIQAGDDPDRQTYAWEMQCTGHRDSPQFRWMFWKPFAEAALSARLHDNLNQGD
jgi:hypothetical protein